MNTTTHKWSLLPALWLVGAAVLVLAGCGGGERRAPEDVRGPEIPIMPVDDHGDSRSDATALALGGTVPEAIEEGDDNDYFRVEVTESGTLTVHTTGNLDTVGELQSGDGTSLASADDTQTDTNFSIKHGVVAGTYYVRIGSEGMATGSYEVHASFVSDMPALPPDESDTPEGSTELTPGQTVTGYVHAVDDPGAVRRRAG